RRRDRSGPTRQGRRELAGSRADDPSRLVKIEIPAWDVIVSHSRIKRKAEVDPEYWTTRDVQLIGVHRFIPRSLMAGTRKRYSAAFKARFALEAAKQNQGL